MKVKNYVIKQARLINEKRVDILVENGIIQKIAPHIESSYETLDFHNDYVSAGWIDIHTHCFDKFEIYGDQPDLIGYPHGVCTVVDAGTAGSDTIDEFYQQAQKAQTRVYSLLNISSPGIFAQDELANLKRLNQESIMKSCQKYPDFIVGLKARMSKSVLGESGNQPLVFAKDMQKLVNLPIMVHIGTAPSLLEDVVDMLDASDIITHIFNPKENGIIKENQIKVCVDKAIKKGILLDLGHGTDSFSFEVARLAFDNNIYVNTISSDIYFRNRLNGPVYDLATTMNKMLYTGYTLQQVIDCVTMNAAQSLHLDHLGQIEVGKTADFTVFKMCSKDLELTDSTKKTVVTHQYIQPTHTIVKNQIYQVEEEK